MNPQNLAIVKMAVHLVAVAGIFKILRGIVDSNVETETFAEKAQVYAGTLVIGELIAEHASDYTDKRVDQTIELIHEVKGFFQEKNPRSD